MSFSITTQTHYEVSQNYKHLLEYLNMPKTKRIIALRKVQDTPELFLFEKGSDDNSYLIIELEQNKSNTQFNKQSLTNYCEKHEVRFLEPYRITSEQYQQF